jgi:ornithine cyclodeaminase/alanine dehydrogenase-like protein (mu-crystallin family)
MDGTYITAARTAVTSAVGAIAVARHHPRSMAIIGSGVQAEAHLDAFRHLVGPEEIRVVTRSEASAKRIASHHVGVVGFSDPQEALQGVDIVCCCTDAPDPVIDDTWVKPGAFVCSVGSGRELPGELLARARVFVESRSNATAAIPAGAIELQGVDPASLIELGEVLSGRRQGHTGNGEVAVYKSTGHASEDVAAAAVVLRRAKAAGRGTIVAVSS